MSQSDSLGLPQVAACLLVGYFVFRWFFKSTDPSSVLPARSPVVDQRRLQEQSLLLTGMFPQVSMAAAQAELIRNGGNIEIATEKILAAGGLPEPPTPVATPLDSSTARSAPAAAAHRTAAHNVSGASASRVGGYQDLITRYNLHGRLDEGDASSSSTLSGKGKSPQSRSDRQLAHQNKRDEMILAARRRMEEMDRKQAATKGQA
ncbi:hypothetical protein C7212DRAFT_330216 [Tuber magnatum]|uniref:CUE domain-containing protein n=1 Tax=Tuber magnatum TaxID=42249 RepID=A0A317SKK2_9PEZI|nr:hypothetical protein C7212DRAFT_330216 [Tuber magnatum]